MSDTQSNGALGALLVDLENLHLAIKDRYVNASEVTMTILQRLRSHLKDDRGITPVVGRGYAPLDYSTSRHLINDLALMGITPVHVLARASKNSADLMLAIDAMEILFNRPDITTFVIVGGDRDYIPVVERIRQNARGILVVSPRHAMSGDLLTIIGKESYLDPVELLPPELLIEKESERIAPPVTATAPVTEPVIEAATPTGAEETPAAEPEREGDEQTPEPEPLPARAEPTQPFPKTMAELADFIGDNYELEEQKKCMKVLLEFRQRHRVQEVWLGPFLREMNDAFPYKSNADRKSLLNRMCKTGATQIVDRLRSGEGGTYASLIINWEHPLVIEMNPG